VTLGRTPRQADLLRSTASLCEGRFGSGSIYGVLHRECFTLFPDEMFGDLFTDVGRRSVPPMIVAVVMVLQRIEGLSDREAVDRFVFDARWKYAAGGLDFDYPGFVHTVLVDMRARLAASEWPDRIFEVTLAAARAAGLVGRRRVLDSTPLYDAVATMDILTLIRSAIRGLLKVVDAGLAAELAGVLTSGDDYASAAKPAIDWDDRASREALIDSRARDAHALLALLEGRELPAAVAQACALLATAVGQDLDDAAEGVFRIARRVARDRVISTVDPDARHGHRTSARGFDGYKGHAGIDPDSELVTATRVTPGNTGDAAVAEHLITDLLDAQPDLPVDAREEQGAGQPDSRGEGSDAVRPKVYGDSAYGCGEFQSTLEDHGFDSGCKTQPPTPPPGGLFSKDRFGIDLGAGTVTCPAAVTAPIRRNRDGSGVAAFASACPGCPLRAQCTTAAGGRTVAVHAHENVLARARARQTDPDWQADYRATPPKVERKLGHLMRRRHGGRRARVRGQLRLDADFRLLAAAINLARLAVLGLRFNPVQGWTVP
jgi:hypothetical protein